MHQKHYRTERATYLNMLRIAARFYFKTKNEEFKEHMQWISDQLQHVEKKRKNGTYKRWIERSEELDRHLKILLVK